MRILVMALFLMALFLMPLLAGCPSPSSSGVGLDAAPDPQDKGLDGADGSRRDGAPPDQRLPIDLPQEGSVVGDLDVDGATDGPKLNDGPGVCETSPPKLTRVATLNAYCLKGDPMSRVQGIADEVVRLDLMAIGLQEVCQTQGAGGSDNFAFALTEALAKRTGYGWDFRYTKTHVAWDTYDEGLGIVAPAGAFVDSGERVLPQGGGAFPRKVLWAKIQSRGDALLFYTTHFTISKTATDRRDQARAIVDLLRSHRSLGLPQIVVGDLNTNETSDAVAAFKAGPPALFDVYRQAHPTEAGHSCCSPNFGIRIDFIFADSAAFSGVNEADLAFTQPTGLSDHKGVYGVLRSAHIPEPNCN